jgi:hypothetical protein
MKKQEIPDVIEAVRAMPKFKQQVFGPALPEHGRLGACIICGGIIRVGFNGYYCKDCGIHYDKLPNEKAIERLRIKDESVLRMSLQTRKRFVKKMDKIQANLNHNRRMK